MVRAQFWAQSGPNIGNHKMPHDMRRLATTRYLQSGLSEVETASLTGHESLEMIQRYAVMDAPRQRNALRKVAAPSRTTEQQRQLQNALLGGAAPVLGYSTRSSLRHTSPRTRRLASNACLRISSSGVPGCTAAMISPRSPRSASARELKAFTVTKLYSWVAP